MVFVFSLVSSELLPKIPIDLYSVLQTSNSKYWFYLNKFWIHEVLLSRSLKPFLIDVFGHHNVIGDFSKGLSINVLRVYFWNVTSISWNVAYLFLMRFYLLIWVLILRMVACIAWDGVFNFASVNHFKFELKF